jgi:hypothetical protein
MNRREFLVHATIGGVTVPLLVTEIGCSDDEGPGPDSDSESFTSSSNSGHTHTITIHNSDLTGGGPRSYTSSSNSGHSHIVDLEASDIDNLSVGCVVNKTSSSTSGHTHTWRFLLAGFVVDVETTSTLVAGHTHAVSVPSEDLTSQSPPDRPLTTSEVSGHTHTILITSTHYATLQNCQSVFVTSSTDDGHSHDFVIQRTGAPVTGEVFNSSSSSGHTHTIIIPSSDVTAGGAHSYISSSNSGHTHTVDLNAAEIDNLSIGCVVNKMSSNNSGHIHAWRILFAGFVADIPVTSVSDTSGHSHQITVPSEDLTSASQRAPKSTFIPTTS